MWPRCTSMVLGLTKSLGIDQIGPPRDVRAIGVLGVGMVQHPGDNAAARRATAYRDGHLSQRRVAEQPADAAGTGGEADCPPRRFRGELRLPDDAKYVARRREQQGGPHCIQGEHSVGRVGQFTGELHARRRVRRTRSGRSPPGHAAPADLLTIRRTPSRLPPAPPWLGLLTLAQAAPRAAAAWTGNGTSHEQRGLKHRPEGSVWTVPILPILVTMLRHHDRYYGTAPDGRMFRGTRGGPLSESNGRTWHAARTQALGPAAATALARRPYDLPAPRGAPSYPRHSREELGRRFLGLMANPASKD
jgi:hypothetical protein